MRFLFLGVCAAGMFACSGSDSSSESALRPPDGNPDASTDADFAMDAGSDAKVGADAAPCRPPSGGTPRTLVALGALPHGLATDGSFVFYTAGNALMKVAVTGGTPTPVATGARPDVVLLGASDVYWSDVAVTNEDFKLSTMPKAGGATRVIETHRKASFTGLTIDGTYLCWVTSQGGALTRQVLSMASDAETLGTLTDAGQNVQELAISGSKAYYGRTTDLSAELMSIPLAGGSPTVVLSSLDGFANSVRADARRVYVSDDKTVRAVDVASGKPSTIAAQQEGPTGLFVDGDEIYWANVRAGTIKRARVDGSCPVTIASGQGEPSAVVVDANRVYWLTGRALVAVPK